MDHVRALVQDAELVPQHFARARAAGEPLFQHLAPSGDAVEPVVQHAQLQQHAQDQEGGRDRQADDVADVAEQGIHSDLVI